MNDGYFYNTVYITICLNDITVFLKKKDKKTTGKALIEDNIAKASEYSVESSDLLKKLEECSLTQEQVIKAGYASVDETIGPLVFRNSFFLQNNTLVIVLDGDFYITLCLDDIADFLKVEKW